LTGERTSNESEWVRRKRKNCWKWRNFFEIPKTLQCIYTAETTTSSLHNSTTPHHIFLHKRKTFWLDLKSKKLHCTLFRFTVTNTQIGLPIFFSFVCHNIALLLFNCKFLHWKRQVKIGQNRHTQLHTFSPRESTCVCTHWLVQDRCRHYGIHHGYCWELLEILLHLLLQCRTV